MALEDDLYQQRLGRIAEIEALGFRAYGQRFDFTHTIPQILEQYGAKTAEQLEPRVAVRVAGRIATIRHMGKAGFAHLLQNGERLQIYVRKDAVPEKDFALYERLDIGDIVGAEGYLFRTRTGELSIHVERLHFLAKTLLSMPEKWHGLEDVETRYRQRYLDLIANPEVRRDFRDAGQDRGFPAAATGGARLSWKWRRPCCSRCTAARRRGRSSRTTTRWIWICIFGSRRNCI